MTELDKLQLRVDRAKRSLRRWIDFLKSMEAAAPNGGSRHALEGIRMLLGEILADLEGETK